jgi:rhamnosyltransferase
MTLRVAAIYTTYRPEPGFRSRIEPVVARCAETIVVDNTPGGHPFTDLGTVVVLQDGINKGLGRALNIGIAEARRRGCDAVVLFDQDSTPNGAFIDTLVSAHARLGARKVCVGPYLLDDQYAGESSAEARDDWAPKSVTCLPTSGMFFGIEDLEPEDDFSQEFFLDFADLDWCWRLRAKGWQLFQLDHFPMLHRQGLAQRHIFGLVYHVPAPYRHYFQFRETLRLLPRAYVPLYAKFRFGLLLPAKVVVYPFLLDRGWERLGWMLRGVRDALRGVGGVGAAGVKLSSVSATASANAGDIPPGDLTS